jgi:hypothetical protein
VSNPTQYFGWTIPTDASGQNWYSVFQAIWDAADVQLLGNFESQVACLQATMSNLAMRSTLVLSSAVGVRVSSVEMAAGHAGWAICSAAPFGRLAGSFVLTSSGGHAWYQMDLAGTANSRVGSFAAGSGCVVTFRLVTTRVGVNTMTHPVNATWNWHAEMAGVDNALPPLTDVVSLGPGTYNVELQAQVALISTATSAFFISSLFPMQLSVREVLVPR